jgi:hypothetical protein
MRPFLVLPLFLGACAVALPARAPTPRPPAADAPAAPVAQPCGSAHDHCLPPDTVFAYDPESLDEAYVGKLTDEGPWLYIRSDVMRGGARSWTSEPATAATLSASATVVYYGYGEAVPASEADAIHGTWRIATVAAIDAGAGTLITSTGKTVLIETARLVR